jgi:hypothetical protein
VIVEVMRKNPHTEIQQSADKPTTAIPKPSGMSRVLSPVESTSYFYGLAVFLACFHDPGSVVCGMA